MPIASEDILFKLSIVGDGPGDDAGSTPNASLGDFISTTEITDATLHNLFDVITGDENAAETVDYRCIFVHNSHATLTLLGAVVWLQSETAGGADIAISVDTTAASAVDSSSPQAKTIANETTAPATQSFSSPTTKGAGLTIGDLDAGEVRAIWIQRTATDSAALDVDGVVLRVEGDTTE